MTGHLRFRGANSYYSTQPFEGLRVLGFSKRALCRGTLASEGLDISASYNAESFSVRMRAGEFSV